ncbi:hypothetical protein AcV7_002388 [Taiwanofungus camphoratus]|nr:hypothetical protein AcV7_002388 [Antrodia cinnamomea]
MSASTSEIVVHGTDQPARSNDEKTKGVPLPNTDDKSDTSHGSTLSATCTPPDKQHGSSIGATTVDSMKLAVEAAGVPATAPPISLPNFRGWRPRGPPKPLSGTYPQKPQKPEKPEKPKRSNAGMKGGIQSS